MKSNYFQHVPRSDDEISNLWQNALVVLDTNTLLNLYRWSEDTVAQFFDILEGLTERLWLPDQVAFEYFKNREVAIDDAKRSYEEAIVDIKNLHQKFDAKRGHPHLSKKAHLKLSKVTAEISEELELGSQGQRTLLSSDPTREKLLALYDGRVGEAFSNEDMDALFVEGKNRYEERTPPGYKDIKKAEGGKRSDLKAAYGDLILWRQVMNHAKALGQDVILVTDDAKEDWFNIVAGQQTVGPRPELLAEFNAETGHHVAIYRPERFIEHSKTMLKSKFTKEAIEEVREVSKRAASEGAKLARWRNLQLHSDRTKMNRERRTLPTDDKYSKLGTHLEELRKNGVDFEIDVKQAIAQLSDKERSLLLNKVMQDETNERLSTASEIMEEALRRYPKVNHRYLPPTSNDDDDTE